MVGVGSSARDLREPVMGSSILGYPSSYPPASITLKGVLIPTTECRLLL